MLLATTVNLSRFSRVWGTAAFLFGRLLSDKL